MCGRTLISEAKELAAKAGLQLGGENKAKDTNRPPGTEMPVIIDARPGKLHYIRWGLIPAGSIEPPKFSTTYARIETMHTLPSYRTLIGRRHCVFVVDGFYEFDKRQTPSQPYYFQRKDAQTLYLAGLWDTWKDPVKDMMIPSCTMIMQPANEFIGQIHDRMPCILSASEAMVWLEPSVEKQTRLSLLNRVSNDLLDGWPVDKRVNDAKNKDDNNNEQLGTQLKLL
ncbi:SOS response-associated peptidase [Sphingobacterium chungjuense]|uniref:SOS response-associated peptidase n=1 Tax=Sphingobacterium chungjuense TaxID=2675553 RepID=UPI001409CE14|nr:SOS response-associated peptidase [Sphingobacterium chungjuense]